MKIGLHSVSYSGTWGGQTALSLPDFIRKAAALGYDNVELAGKRPHASPLDMDAAARQSVRSLLSELGLTLSCVASYHDFAAFYEHKDMAMMEKELLYMQQVIELTRDLGGSLVRTYTGYFKEGVPYRSQWDACVAGIAESAAIAARYGITIGVQNHSCIASDPDSLLDFLEEIKLPNVKAVLDAPFIDNHNKPIRETVLKYDGLVVHTHLTDFIRRDKYKYISETVTHEKNGLEMIAVPIGRGSIDYRAFVGALHEIGFDGTLSYEMCSPLVGGGSEANLDRCADESLQYVRGLIAELSNYWGEATSS
ncbi:MAG: sugar phosphate isomerase/epimerase [Paenibacillaceae bacterium]|nr:sugar phosphate isomerase/epimerase [Paenibacillaceae bacterium]